VLGVFFLPFFVFLFVVGVRAWWSAGDGLLAALLFPALEIS